ncbi:MAG: methyltransferase domain-containing protein [Chloroflexi bacterium]|nr:methyltransferase domain-containing protein [Chloroflexota bacterium]
MTTFKDIFGNLHGGKILDVATGTGRFAEVLKEDLASYTEIIGIDTSDRAQQAFQSHFDDPSIRFMQMDANTLDFPDASFDTVSISYSLHHLPEPLCVLNEMKRVLKPGGHFIVSEMYCDSQAETQMTHVLLHHWWAAVDTARGVCHNPTYPRAEIVSMLGTLGLDFSFHDLVDLTDDPLAADTVTEIDGIIDQYVQERIQGVPGEEKLRIQGEALRKRAHEIGFHGASVLVAVGQKS